MVVCLARPEFYRARDVQLPVVDVVDEGDVVGRVPVEAVANQIEGHRLKQLVDWSHHLEQ